ncbi:MAG: PDZ domain-containing protein, partial [Phycisphaerae bacterium]|nr:PDZ domain-containing protein [Phycisphaerae bacterium]
PGRDAAAGDGEDQPPPMPRARLGVAPSYAGEGGEGFAIEYVIEDGPAAKAGMKDSDVIVSIGGKPIKDIYSYMEAMTTFKPGQEVEVVVLRGGEKVKLKVTLEETRRPQRE